MHKWYKIPMKYLRFFIFKWSYRQLKAYKVTKLGRKQAKYFKQIQDILIFINNALLIN